MRIAPLCYVLFDTYIGGIQFTDLYIRILILYKYTLCCFFGKSPQQKQGSSAIGSSFSSSSSTQSKSYSVISCVPAMGATIVFEDFKRVSIDKGFPVQYLICRFTP